MRRVKLLVVASVLVVACGPGGSSGPRYSVPRSPASAARSTSPEASASAAPLASSYGLLLSAGTLEMISPDGAVAASAPVAAPSVQFCSSAHDGAIEQPPVSASSDLVYFRDGDTKIRSLSPNGQTADVTTVPGGPTTISFFSVSPDDKRIAVLVEDLSGASTISLRLYVEDLNGGGNHKTIYTTTTPKGKGGSTLWPMGWHAGQLVLAVVVACTFEPAGLTPSAWHVVNASTAIRTVNIHGNCILSYWPSPAGVLCVGTSSAAAYDWTGRVTVTLATSANDYESGLSPSGQRIFFATGTGIGAPAPASRVVALSGGSGISIAGHSACLWFDDTHLLAPDAVITYPSGAVTVLPASGECAGSFPGGL